jgi:hypothetical protein
MKFRIIFPTQYSNPWSPAPDELMTLCSSIIGSYFQGADIIIVMLLFTFNAFDYLCI